MASGPNEVAGSFPESNSESGPIAEADEIEVVEGVLEDLPPEQRQAIVQTIRAEMSHSGPLPSPQQLQRYEEVLPGLAERIVRLTEREQEHRHTVVDLAVKRNARLRERGQIFGMAALVLTLAFCVYLVATGNPYTGGTVAVGLVAAAVGIFVTGRHADARESAAEREVD